MQLVSVKTKTKKRVGRGLSAGQGKTAGRGTKGQKSRSGHNIPNRYEGGQSTLALRLPKLPGFKSFHVKPTVVTLDMISKCFKDKDIVSLVTLREKGLIKHAAKAKILNSGTLTVAITLADDVKASESVRLIIAAAAKTKTVAVEKVDTDKAEKTDEEPKIKKVVAKKTASKK
ncbi:MAG: 50S ribosomal protein L15 [bacterium]